MVASHTPPTGGLALNPGVCPDWELNQRPFGSQDSTQFPISQGLFSISFSHVEFLDGGCGSQEGERLKAGSWSDEFETRG